MIKYYGGKSWLKKYIYNYLPIGKVQNVIDLFVGGGSITDEFVNLKFDNIIINDIDTNLINFYNIVKEYPQELIAYLQSFVKNLSFEDVKKFRNNMFAENDKLTSAYKYYCCVYSGYGGKPYASPTLDKFNQLRKRNYEKDIWSIKYILDKCKIYNLDYNEIKELNSFYYCDPPYYKVGDNTYYGQNGRNHKDFDHIKFYNYINEISKNNYVMISYEDSKFIRELYKDWTIIELDKKTINFNPNKKCSETLSTPELLIMNYNTNKIICNVNHK